MEHIIDAKGETVGRIASKIAVILQGKHKTSYDPSKIGAEKVIVKNAHLMKFSGRKLIGKVYYRHTGYMGHLRSKTLREALEKDPSWVLRNAVKGMLPKNFIQARRMRFLTIETAQTKETK